MAAQNPRVNAGGGELLPLGDADAHALVTRSELLDSGADPVAVDRLPVRHVADGEPFWSVDEARDMLALAAGGVL